MKNLYTLLLLFIFIAPKAHSQTQTLSFQVDQPSDDAEESEDGSQVLITSSDLELTFDDFSNQNSQTVGIRFTDVTIPENAIILNAYIQFHADDIGDTQTDLNIQGEAAAFSNTFTTSPGNISSRNTTIQSVDWFNVPAWPVTHLGGVNERTPDLSILVSEMIANNGWSYGNPLTFIINGTGNREAESFDGTSDEAPILVVDFSVPQIDFDLGISDMQGINNFMYPQNDVSISTLVTNHGLNPIDSFILSYSIDNITIGSDTIYQSLASNDSYSHSFSQTLDLNTTGTYDLKIEVSSNNDAAVFNNTIEFEFEVIPEYSNLYFGTSSTWKYLDNGANLGTAWRDLNYDDSDWDLGSGQFGFGDGDENTLLENGNITYYFRKLIEIENIDLISTIVASLSADDAVVIYVNGQELARTVNLPEGPIMHSTTPDRDVPHDFEDHPVKYDIPLSYFNTGINVIAVEVYNLSSTDNDLSFSCAFLNQVISYSVDGPYVIYRDGEMLVKSVTENGPVLDTLPANATPTLTCNLPNGDSFNFNLMESFEIPESEYEMPNKFLVTSDIEGQIEAYIYLLQGAGVIDENYNWTYGDGHLYFIGDLFDRGEFVTQCLWLLYKLEQEAQQAGGQVHFIIGNHEVLNFVYDYRYVREKYFENAHYQKEMLYDLFEQNTELGQWLRSKNILENAGNSAILVHAGLSPQVKDLNLTYQQINDYGRLGMDDNCPNGNTDCETVNGGSDEGVYWYRGIADEELTQTEVDDIVSSFNGEQMIFGHTVFPQVSPLYQQKVIVVDVDHEDNYDDGYMEALYYEGGCYHRLVINSSGPSLTLLDPNCEFTNSTESDIKNRFDLRVNPSLFKNELSIQYSGDLTEGKLLIYNSLGVLLKAVSLDMHRNDLTLNTSAWAKGAYIISLQSGDETTSEKVIKY